MSVSNDRILIEKIRKRVANLETLEIIMEVEEPLEYFEFVASKEDNSSVVVDSATYSGGVGSPITFNVDIGETYQVQSTIKLTGLLNFTGDIGCRLLDTTNTKIVGSYGNSHFSSEGGSLNEFGFNTVFLITPSTSTLTFAIDLFATYGPGRTITKVEWNMSLQKIV